MIDRTIPNEPDVWPVSRDEILDELHSHNIKPTRLNVIRAAIERGHDDVFAAAIAARIESAFRLLGVEQIVEGDGRGAGVLLAEPEGGATIIRRSVLRGGEEVGVVLRFGGQTMTARVSVAALAADGNTDAALQAFDFRRAAVANAGRAQARGRDHRP